MRKVLLSTITSLLMALSCHADVYLYRDDQGAARYSNTAPGQQARDVSKLKTKLKFLATFGAGSLRDAPGTGPSNDGVWWVEQKAGTSRAKTVNIDGGTVLRLHTEPGDRDVSGSGNHERNDVALSQATTDCYEGREQWWEHTIFFPDDYNSPPPGPGQHWYALSNFHHTGKTGQSNFTLYHEPGVGFLFGGFGGTTVANDPSHPGYFSARGGPVRKNTWYNLVYHVKWSSGSDGFLDAWVNGTQKLTHRGPTLYKGMGCYLKLANYHTAFGQPSSVIYGRVIRQDVEQP